MTLMMNPAKIMSSKRIQTQRRTFIIQFDLYNIEKQAEQVCSVVSKNSCDPCSMAGECVERRILGCR